MTAKDSKSTPKKAEDQPRHPLALLAEKWEAQAAECQQRAMQYPEDSTAGTSYGSTAATYAKCATQLREALRAQAEAAAGPRDRAMFLEGYQTGMSNVIAHAGLSSEPGEIERLARRSWDERPQRQVQRRAALAQAGAGSEGGEAQ